MPIIDGFLYFDLICLILLSCFVVSVSCCLSSIMLLFFLLVTRSLKHRFNYCFITTKMGIRPVDLRNQPPFKIWQRYRLKVLRPSVDSIQPALCHHCIIIIFFLHFLQYDVRLFQSFKSSRFKTSFIFHKNHFYWIFRLKNWERKKNYFFLL